MPYYYYGMDWTYILIIIGMIISLIAQAKVKSTYNRFSKVRAENGMTGCQAASMILNNAGIGSIPIAHISGNLTDNYDPSSRVLHLSDSTYDSPSVAAIGVAAHECGHAIQHKEGYSFLNMRSALYPAANFTQKIAWPAIVIGLLFYRGIGDLLITIGILAFSVGVLFQLITLPVEFNASRRAVSILKAQGNMSDKEISQVKKVLTAAALTYVAAAASSILSLLRLVLISKSRRR